MGGRDFFQRGSRCNMARLFAPNSPSWGDGSMKQIHRSCDMLPKTSEPRRVFPPAPGPVPLRLSDGLQELESGGSCGSAALPPAISATPGICNDPIRTIAAGLSHCAGPIRVADGSPGGIFPPFQPGSPGWMDTDGRADSRKCERRQQLGDSTQPRGFSAVRAIAGDTRTTSSGRAGRRQESCASQRQPQQIRMMRGIPAQP